MVTKTGTAGNDTLLGTDGIDILFGLGGDDQLVGGKGADTLDGGSGIDTVSYANATSGVSVDLLFNVGSAGDAFGDKLFGMENVTGTAFADTLRGNNIDNVLRGGGGADLLDGSGGVDTADYAAAKLGVVVSLLETTGFGGEASGDRYASIENVTGSAFADDIEGDGGDNRLNGGGGNDLLNGSAGKDALIGGDGNDRVIGASGADVLEGGGGVDLLDYGSSAASVFINLGTNSTGFGDASGDTISGFESVIGSAHGDTLTGSAAANLISGGGGGDIISGGSGNDTLAGGAGTDQITGGSGVDTANYSSETVSGIQIDLDTGFNFGGDAQGDVLNGIENVIGSGQADNIFGDDRANALSGGAGNDFILGGSGDDILTGGALDDFLNGGAGIDTLNYSGSQGGVFIDLKINEADEASSLGGPIQGASDAIGDDIIGFENVIGSAFSDALRGGDGANRLSGGAGFDFIGGGLGRDDLAGGGGTDNFDFSSFGDSGATATTRDRVRDFHHAEGDLVRLGTGGDLTFIGTKAFTADDQLRFFFEGGHTVVEMNTVGKAGAEMQIEFDGHVNFVANDFAFEL